MLTKIVNNLTVNNTELKKEKGVLDLKAKELNRIATLYDTKIIGKHLKGLIKDEVVSMQREIINEKQDLMDDMEFRIAHYRLKYILLNRSINHLDSNY